MNFTTNDAADNIACTVRIATPEFSIGDLPANTSVYIDVDVFTQAGFRTKEQAIVNDWVETAHIKEKQQFFRLLTAATIDRLK